MIIAGILGAVLVVIFILDERDIRRRNECIRRELERPEWWR